MNLSLRWLAGLIARRRGRLVATAIGVALTVSLLAAIGSFLSGTTAAMTERAISRVPLDWQVQGVVGADPAALLAGVKAFPGVTTALPVGYGTTAGYAASVKGAATTAGPGLVLGIPSNYRATFPDEFAQLIGSTLGSMATLLPLLHSKGEISEIVEAVSKMFQHFASH